MLATISSFRTKPLRIRIKRQTSCKRAKTATHAIANTSQKSKNEPCWLRSSPFRSSSAVCSIWIGSWDAGSRWAYRRPYSSGLAATFSETRGSKPATNAPTWIRSWPSAPESPTCSAFSTPSTPNSGRQGASNHTSTTKRRPSSSRLYCLGGCWKNAPNPKPPLPSEN